MTNNSVHNPLTNFAAMLSNANSPLRQNGFKRWHFYPGMSFGTIQKWWGDFGKRDFPHEGVDFCLYEGTDGQIFHLDANSAIPVIDDGLVRAIFKDYLGKAVIIEHDHWQGSEQRLLSIYAHTDPLPHIQTGVHVEKGMLIATTTDTRNAKAKILPHLHLSLGVASPDLSFENFYWNLLRDAQHVTLLDPLKVIQLPYHQPRARFPKSITNNA